MDDDKAIDKVEAKRRAAERSAAMLAGDGQASALPPDPQLTADAQALRERYKTAVEVLTAHYVGEIELTASQLAAARAVLPYQSRPQQTSAKLEIDNDARIAALSAALDSLTDDQLDNAMRQAQALIAKAAEGVAP